MATHDVKLHYFSTGNPPPNDVEFAAKPNKLAVRVNQTIKFSPATGNLPGSIVVRFRDTHCFSSPNPQFAATGEYRTGDPDILVKIALPPGTVSIYDCSLLDSDGVPLAIGPKSSGTHGIRGGEIIMAFP
jgi:hypothetical protein